MSEQDKALKHRFRERLTGSPLAKALMVAFLILLLQIPVSQVEDLIWERANRYDSVVSEITDKWGGEQSLTGPLLIIPIESKIKSAGGEYASGYTKRRYLMVTPSSLDVSVNMESEVRYRGIYEVPLYQARAELSGQFEVQEALSSLDPQDKVLWDEAVLSIALGDVRAVQSPLTLEWNGLPLSPQPGTRMANSEGIHARLSGGVPDLETRIPFRASLVLNGSRGLYITPIGQESQVEITGNWSDPSFQGDWLPTRRDIDEAGFSGSWNIPFLAKGLPASWMFDQPSWTQDTLPSVGVMAPQYTGNYQTIERSVKYAVLFLACTFACLWLFEVLSGVPIHAIQYLFTGLTLCLFYLLFLSLSEHIGVWLSYIIASSAVVCQLGWYCSYFSGNRYRTLALVVMLVVLYGYLLSLLQEQDFALLYGSFGLFVLLAIGMFATRKVDWYRLTELRLQSGRQDPSTSSG
ncbi:cell envelope integrity protein CreD [Hahella sp. CCB-MM4]|uniref:cell envelope integrity protein CreD n=1 Tax=Hahella sp. (strain CCB-MM4) TaxID=1926491 RepID=UPI000B9B1005|nr:cell envelope integrity protein CreD [Hahella sp. CCB-MM4]OZG74717.1 cell envelope integrity protein CreD [Hahella sp. CCB-MM4]